MFGSTQLFSQKCITQKKFHFLYDAASFICLINTCTTLNKQLSTTLQPTIFLLKIYKENNFAGIPSAKLNTLCKMSVHNCSNKFFVVSVLSNSSFNKNKTRKLPQNGLAF